eukprot:CAMPEP_0201126038 /NCGR_PEP_ID=MMETSP0850-20130426/24328_1 /ASSEMBLY_ACC=CAM_ASM_000622 /TAXON_ID=183588 /ORGANISM="Pseudo-nitzschia fraudulenta, Strain WWA7" /LENGTH=79 /DNA_ID=CAMNT_0047394289 /DNA_START=469 /DNA_END=708 /DNA_ORIENTATION=-
MTKMKHQPRTQMEVEFLYSSWLFTSNSIMENIIAISGATTMKPISHWYFDADAKTINFLFLLMSENDFLRFFGEELVGF